LQYNRPIAITFLICSTIKLKYIIIGGNKFHTLI
jgi:hypothetical protein